MTQDKADFQAVYSSKKPIKLAEYQLIMNLSKFVSALERRLSARNFWKREEARKSIHKILIEESNSFDKKYDIPFQVLSQKLLPLLFNNDSSGYSLNYSPREEKVSYSWPKLEMTKEGKKEITYW